MFTIARESLWQRRRRLTGTATAIVLAVAFLVATLTLGDTFASNFDRLFHNTAASTAVVIRSSTSVSDEPNAPRGLIDADVLDAVQTVDGVAAAVPEITGYGQLLDHNGDPLGGNGPPRTAGSWIDNPDLNPYRLVEGHAPNADDEVVINRGVADAGGLGLGDTTVVQTPRPVQVTIVGIATFGDEDGFGQSTFTAFSFDGAQRHITARPGAISNVLVQADPGTSDAALRDRITEILPDEAQAITGSDLVDERLDSLGFLTIVRVVLVGFALIAVLVAAVSINNTFTITFAHRVRELALLRAVGASRRQTRQLMRIEAATVGVVASLVGVGVGLGLAVGLKALFASFGSGLPAGGLTVRPVAILTGIVVGVAVTMLAARAPARRAGRVAPIEALRATNNSDDPLAVRRVTVGLVLLAASAMAIVGGVFGSSLATALGAAGLIAASLTLAPALVPLVARGVGLVVGPWRGVNVELAVDNVRRQPRRVASAATALLIGVAVVALFTVFTASAKTAIDDTVSDGFGNAQLAVNTPAFGGGSMSPEIITELDDTEGVDQAEGIATVPVKIDGASSTGSAASIASIAPVLGVDTVDGTIATDSSDQAGVIDIVAERSTADDNGWSVGTEVDLTFVDGDTLAALIVAVVADHELLEGVVIPSTEWLDHDAQPGLTTVFITVTDDANIETVRQGIAPIARSYSGEIQDRAQFSASRTGGLDLLLGVVYVMLALAILIALLGIANTLSLSVYERRNEVGLLRAIGQTRRQVRRVLRTESIIVAALGTLLGIIVGSVCGWVMYEAVFDHGHPTIPVGSLLVIATLGMLAGALAAWRPARRASTVPVLDAIASPT